MTKVKPNNVIASVGLRLRVSRSNANILHINKTKYIEEGYVSVTCCYFLFSFQFYYLSFM